MKDIRNSERINRPSLLRRQPLPRPHQLPSAPPAAVAAARARQRMQEPIPGAPSPLVPRREAAELESPVGQQEAAASAVEGWPQWRRPDMLLHPSGCPAAATERPTGRFRTAAAAVRRPIGCPAAVLVGVQAVGLHAVAQVAADTAAAVADTAAAGAVAGTAAADTAVADTAAAAAAGVAADREAAEAALAAATAAAVAVEAAATAAAGLAAANAAAGVAAEAAAAALSAAAAELHVQVAALAGDKEVTAGEDRCLGQPAVDLHGLGRHQVRMHQTSHHQMNNTMSACRHLDVQD